MRPGEVMDVAVGAYQHLGGTILRYTAIPTLLCLAAVVFVTGYVLPSLGVTKDAQNVKVQIEEAVTLIALAVGVGAPLFLIGLSYTSAFVTGVVSDYMIGAVPDPEANARKARRLIKRMLGLTLYELFLASGIMLVAVSLMMIGALLDSSDPNGSAVEFVAGLGGLAFIVGVLAFPVVACRLCLAVPVSFIEGLKPIHAVKRGRDLLKAKGYHPSGYGTIETVLVTGFFLSLFLWVGIIAGFSMLNVQFSLEMLTAGTGFRDLAQQVAGYLPIFLVLWTVIPVWATSSTILYYERRTRVEGFDIETLAQDVARHAKTSRFEL